MGAVKKMITKKTKEKISSKASFLSPLEKIANELDLQKKINKKLGKKEITSKSFVEKKELNGEIQTERMGVEKKTFKKSIAKRVFKSALGILGFSIGKEVLSKGGTESVTETASDLITNDKKLEIANDEIEKSLKDKNSILSKLRDEEDPAKRKQLQGKIDKYQENDFGFTDIAKESWSDSKLDENGESRGFFSHLFHSTGCFFSNISIYFGVKKAKKLGLFKLQEEVEDIKNKANKTKNSIKKGMENAKQAKKAGTKLRVLRKTPAKDLVDDFGKEITELQKRFSGKEISAKTLAKSMEKANIKLFKEARENGQVKQLVKLMKKGKVPGLEIPAKFSMKSKSMMNRFTKLKINPISMAISVAVTDAGMDARHKGSFSEFGKSLISKETLTEAFVPGVGSWRSVKRNWDNPETPTWLKATYVGLNVAGDIWLAAGYIGSIFSFGSGAAVGLAGKTALMGVGKKLLTREGAKIAAKEIGKKVVTKEGRKVALKAASKTVKDGVKGAVIGSAVMATMEIAMKKFFNKDNVNEAFNNMLSEEQLRSLSLAKQIKGEYKHAA